MENSRNSRRSSIPFFQQPEQQDCLARLSAAHAQIVQGAGALGAALAELQRTLADISEQDQSSSTQMDVKKTGPG